MKSFLAILCFAASAWSAMVCVPRLRMGQGAKLPAQVVGR